MKAYAMKRKYYTHRGCLVHEIKVVDRHGEQHTWITLETEDEQSNGTECGSDAEGTDS